MFTMSYKMKISIESVVLGQKTSKVHGCLKKVAERVFVDMHTNENIGWCELSRPSPARFGYEVNILSGILVGSPSSCPLLDLCPSTGLD